MNSPSRVLAKLIIEFPEEMSRKEFTFQLQHPNGGFRQYKDYNFELIADWLEAPDFVYTLLAGAVRYGEPSIELETKARSSVLAAYAKEILNASEPR